MRNRTSCAQVHELPQSHCGDNREGALFSWLHLYAYDAHLASVKFEHSAVCRGSLMTVDVFYQTVNKKTHFNFSQIFRLFSKSSTMCVDKALDGNFTYTAEN